jgi:hypothetical protein
MPAPEIPDVEALAAATLRCPAVAALHPGGARFAVTPLPNRRVVGVRVDEDQVLVSVVLARGASVRTLETQVRRALAPLVGRRDIDVHVADVVTDDGLDTQPRGR